MQIKISNLRHVFNPKTPWEFEGLKNATTEINQGEYVGIIGSTGSGKTTFIEHLNGLLIPYGGTVEWIFRNELYDKKKKKKVPEMTRIITGEKNRKIKNVKNLRKKIGIAFQFAEYQLFKATILEDVSFASIAFGVPKAEAIEKAKECLIKVGIKEELHQRSPFELSGGQKRRVALAGLLAAEPDILIVDEPTAGLDPVGVREILAILDDLHKQGKTIINVTHDLDNILERSERVLLFKEGVLIKDDEPYEILNDIECLMENNLQPPKLLEFVNKLRKNGLDVPKVVSIEELATFLNTLKRTKRTRRKKE
ncbi:ATP-binding cassette domain-containing protein [Mycoplasma corogypsi]|uniref:ATP-binding cassette domain-containing protein n=1 Tax=Mycoplasma corogypsi TaxID=2106 RepID=UPI0038733414